MNDADVNANDDISLNQKYLTDVVVTKINKIY